MSSIRGLWSHNFSITGTEELIAVWKNATVHRVGSAWRRGPGINLTNDTDAWMTSFLNRVILTNGTDNNWAYQEGFWSQADIVYGSPIAKYCLTFTPGARVFLFDITINGTRYPSRAWYSDLPGNGTLTWGLAFGNDLVQTAGSNTVTSATGVFKTKNVKVGDPFFITSGDNIGKYTVQSVGEVDGDNPETTIILTEELSNSETGSSYWVGGNWFDVGTDDGDIGMGIGMTSNETYFFKKNTLHRYNVTGKELRQVRNALGTTSPRSIISDGGYVYWYHPSGIYRTAGTQEELMSNPIEDLIEGVSDQTAVVGFVNQKLGTINFYLGDITTRDGESISDCVVTFDTNNQTWEPRSYDRPIKIAAKWLKSAIPEVYVGSDTNDVYQWDTGTSFFDTDIPFSLETHVLFPIGPDGMITFDRLRLYIENSQDIQVLYKLYYKHTDGKSWSTDTDYLPLLGSQSRERSEWYFPPGCRASGVKLKFIESSQDDSFLIERFVLYYSEPSNY